MHRGTDVVEDADDTRWFVLVDQITDDLVVEEVNRSPVHSLLNVFLLRNQDGSDDLDHRKTSRYGGEASDR